MVLPFELQHLLVTCIDRPIVNEDNASFVEMCAVRFLSVAGDVIRPTPDCLADDVCHGRDTFIGLARHVSGLAIDDHAHRHGGRR